MKICFTKKKQRQQQQQQQQDKKKKEKKIPDGESRTEEHQRAT